MRPLLPTLFSLAILSFSHGAVKEIDGITRVDNWKKTTGNADAEFFQKDGELQVAMPFRNGERDGFGLGRKLDVALAGAKAMKMKVLIPKNSFLTVEWTVDGNLSRILSYKNGTGDWETVEFPVKGETWSGINLSFGEPADKKDTGDEVRTVRIAKVWLEGDAFPATASTGSAAPAKAAAPVAAANAAFPPSPKPQPKVLPGPNIFQEGDFEKMKKDFAEGWIMGGFCWDPHRPNKVSIEKDGANHFARLHSGLSMDKGAVWVIADPIPLMPDWKNVKAAVVSRLVNFKKGPEGWHGLRIEATWRDAMNKEMKGGKGTLLPEDPTWKESVQDFPVPPGAAMIQFKLGFWSGMGTADIDDLRVSGE